MDNKLNYKNAGVDIDAGNKAVELMKAHIKSTFRPEVLGDLGGFGGLFKIDVAKYRQPVLVSGTDGVGTKLKLAFYMDKHDTVGIDCVAMCVNDILVLGAEPLFFLDYIALGKLIPEKVAAIVKGIAEGCRQAGCALIGGETAEMPDMYGENEYDLAGFVVGITDHDKIINGADIKAGNVVIGFTSSGLHSNGYSLARKVLLDKSGKKINNYVDDFGKTLGEEMLTPTIIYKNTLSSLSDYKINGMAHITGGGLVENLPRILPPGLEFRIDKSSWQVPPVFEMIKKVGKIDEAEMFRTFNMGIGFVLVVPEEDADGLIKAVNSNKVNGISAIAIGLIQDGTGGVIFCGA